MNSVELTRVGDLLAEFLRAFNLVTLVTRLTEASTDQERIFLAQALANLTSDGPSFRQRSMPIQDSAHNFGQGY